ncbi:hypothetical protein TELCIR_22852, partial [Teladorsagia circumcincta]
LIALRIYDGTLKIIQWEDNKDLKSFNVRFEDLAIVDLSFTETSGDSIRLAYISQDSNGRHLKTVELSMVEKELKTISKQDNIETEARMVIPVPLPCGGVIVVGQETILYNGFLLADDHGILYMLVLDVDTKSPNPSVKDLKIESLGETTIAECLVYLDNGVLFIGSRFGDSQLVRLTSQPNPENNSFVQILQTFTNLAPIRDIAVMECDGQNQIITCSGAFKVTSTTVLLAREGAKKLVVACGTRVYYLQCGDMTIAEVANVTLQDEVACIDIGTI